MTPWNKPGRQSSTSTVLFILEEKKLKRLDWVVFFSPAFFLLLCNNISWSVYTQSFLVIKEIKTKKDHKSLGTIKLKLPLKIILPASLQQKQCWLSERFLLSESNRTKSRLVWSCLFLSCGDFPPRYLRKTFSLFVWGSYAGASVPPLGNLKYCWFEHFRASCFISRREICSSAALFFFFL